jgi:hypothetical protein
MPDFEKLGLFYLGRAYDLDAKALKDDLVLYDSRDLVTHAVCVGMTGSGKTGLCLSLLEEAAIDGIPAIAIDPKGDLGNLLLTFPDLTPGEFRPWINEDDARRKGMDPDAFAAAEAERWKKGLAEWGEDGARIQRLRDAADIVIYTPGSEAGIPVSIVQSFAAPPQQVIDDADLMRERIATTAASLLGLVGIDADPIKSREHILLSTIFDRAWRAGQALDLGAIIQQVQTPPVTRVGVLELEAFFPSKDRFELAMALNNLLAAPGFGAWMAGEPLDVQRFLFTPAGKPKIAIFSIAHLGDAERMFFVSLLMNQVLGWMRTQSGTTSLRAVVYMDEIFGYLPPTANPPSKQALLTLMKQARAFGVGIVLATQNPVDLDYKALSNAGTWFIGRLQTERDQLRVLDGLEGVSSPGGHAFDRQAMGRMLAGLGSRVFLMHNVHEDRPEVFQTRWLLSYLRGPLTRAQIRMLTPDSLRAAAREPAAPPAPAPGAQPPAPAAAAVPPAPHAEGPTVAARWVLPPDIPQYFAPSTGSTRRYIPTVLGAAEVRYTDAKASVDEVRTIVAFTPITDDAIAADWDGAALADFGVDDLEREPPPGASFAELPAAAQRTKSYTDWSKSFVTWITRAQTIELLRSPSLKIISKPGESEGDFRARLQLAARERRDDLVQALRQKYAPKSALLQERLRKAQQAVAVQQEQASGSKIQTAISFGATVLGAMFGRKTLSASTLGRASTAARGVGRSMKEAQDVTRAQENVAAVTQQIADLEAKLQEEIADVEGSLQPASEALDTLSLKPKRAGVQVRLLALTWVARDRERA